MDKGEPRLLMINDGAVHVAVWLQTSLVGQGTTAEVALRNLLIVTGIYVADYPCQGPAEDPGDDVFELMYASSPEYPVDGPSKAILHALRGTIRHYLPKDRPQDQPLMVRYTVKLA